MDAYDERRKGQKVPNFRGFYKHFDFFDRMPIVAAYSQESAVYGKWPLIGKARFF
jgi:hypothetical protein